MKMKQPFKVFGSDSAMMVDISDEACMRFGGFRHGMRIIDPEYDEGTVIGVAPAEDSEAEVLWYRLESSGDIVYWGETTDWIGEGFIKVFGEPVKETVEKVVYALRSRVVGKAGAAGEDAVIVRNEIAYEQERMFREAGYKDVRIEMVRVLVDEDGNEHLIKCIKSLDAPASEMVIPARYRAERMYPGVNVYDYDRDVLKRQERATGSIALAVIILICIMVMVMAMPLMMVAVAAEKHFIWGLVGAYVLTIALGSQLSSFAVSIARKLAGLPPIKK